MLISTLFWCTCELVGVLREKCYISPTDRGKMREPRIPRDIHMTVRIPYPNVISNRRNMAQLRAGNESLMLWEIDDALQCEWIEMLGVALEWI